MADKINTTKRVEIQCVDCGAVVAAIFRTKKRCDDCKRLRHRKVSRESERRLPPRNRSVVKNMFCGRCGDEFTTANGSRRYCDQCVSGAVGPSPHHYLRTGASALATTLECEGCSRVVRRKTKSQMFCSRRCLRTSRRSGPQDNINARMRAGIHKSLSKGKGGRSWTELVGYSAADLKLHLELQFENGMSWDNMGEWHIDHRIPLSAFHFETAESAEFKAAWAITNLQPLWARENIQKKAKRLFLI